MKRLCSPLVWLCAAGTLALGALTLLDPNGVYADYVAALDRGTPPIAAVFTAAQDGVYPWSTVGADDISPRSPAYRSLNETVTDEEMRSSVGNNEPFPEPAPVELTPSVEIVMPEPEPTPETEDEESSDSGFITVDQSWFNDALFIGDSHTEGLCDYGGMRNATFYYKRGVDVWSVMKKSFANGNQTIPQALAQRRFGKIYIMLGINEIMCGTTESFAAQYADVVAQLRELQPDALIYIQAIFHTSQKKSDTSSYNNDVINARNAAISAIADGEHVFFVDCNAVFDDENGALTPSYTGDGVHVKAAYYTMWRDYLLHFGREGVETAEPVEQSAPAKPVAPAKPAAPSVPAASTEPAAPAVSAEPAEPAAPVESPAQSVEAPVEPTPEAEVVPVTEESEPAALPETSEASPIPEAENIEEPPAEDSAEQADEKNIESEQNNA